MFQASLLSAILPYLLAIVFAPSSAATLHPFARQQVLSGNTSVLPPGWSGVTQCLENCEFSDPDPTHQFLFGPSFVNSTGMTIELCVNFCDQQNFLVAGLLGDKCLCSNMYNIGCFEDEGSLSCYEDGDPCVGNPAESCGSVAMQWINIFNKGDLCQEFFFGAVSLTSGPWRLSYFYNDTVGARALPHNAVDLHPPLERGNLTVEACVNTCGANGFLLAGTEFADECYCGDALEHNSQPISQCPGGGSPSPANAAAMPCKGDTTEFCGGPNLLYVYTLPGSGLRPLVPFDSIFDGFNPDSSAFGSPF